MQTESWKANFLVGRWPREVLSKLGWPRTVLLEYFFSVANENKWSWLRFSFSWLSLYLFIFFFSWFLFPFPLLPCQTLSLGRFRFYVRMKTIVQLTDSFIHSFAFFEKHLFISSLPHVHGHSTSTYWAYIYTTNMLDPKVSHLSLAVSFPYLCWYFFSCGCFSVPTVNIIV